jgi:protein gp37
MAERTKIQWADSTWDPWRGCTKVSPGCANCYAEKLALRNPAVFGGWGPGAPRVESKSWDEPLGWNRKAEQRRTEHDNRWDGTLRQAFKPESIPPPPRTPWVFPSKCDWLDEEVLREWLARFLALIRRTPNLNWLLLTKRPENWGKRLRDAHAATDGPDRIAIAEWLDGHPPANVWVGASVEDDTRAALRIPRLVDIPAVLRFLSVEPLLGPVNLAYAACNGTDAFGTLPGIHWVIVGGESGPNARPCKVSWIHDVIAQCHRARVPVFVKQLGARPEVEAPSGGWFQPVPVRHRMGGDPAEWPEALRVRETPGSATEGRK